MDPQKKANEIMDALRRKAKSMKAFWNDIAFAGRIMEADVSGDEITDTAQGAAKGAKRTPKRIKADLMKVAAILQEYAALHKAVDKDIEPQGFKADNDR